MQQIADSKMKTGFTVESKLFLLHGLRDMQVGLHRDLVACHVLGAWDELWCFDRWCWREKLNRYPQFHGMKRHRVDRSSSKMGSWRKSWHVRNFKREHDGYQQLKRKQCSTMSKYTNTEDARRKQEALRLVKAVLYRCVNVGRCLW